MTETTESPRTAVETIAALPAHAGARFAQRPASRHLEHGEWRQTSYAQTCAEIEQIARGLIALGIAPGDRVGIVSDTRREWTLVAYAVSSAGAVVVPVYPTSAARECAWVLGDSGARAVICENPAQVDKLASIRGELPELRHVIAIDGEAGDLSLHELRARGDEVGDALAARRDEVTGADVYTIIYTSGTTGPPKGVVLTHSNAIIACRKIQQLDVVRDDELTYLFLPLAHIFAQSTMLASFFIGTAIVYHGGDTREILPELAATQPTYLPSVPRIFEKL
jgi:long-chain acyl-CoA synthetase